MNDMSSFKISAVRMAAFIQKHIMAFSWCQNPYINLVITALITMVTYRLSIIRTEISRRRREIPHGLLEVVSQGEDAKFECV